MSFDLLKKAWLTPTKTKGEKLVLLYIADHSNPKHENSRCWPSLSTIATATGLSKRAVLTSIDSLEDQGTIGTDRNRGRKRRNNYWVTQAISPAPKGEVASPLKEVGKEVQPPKKVKQHPRNGEASSTSKVKLATVKGEVASMPLCSNDDHKGIVTYTVSCGAQPLPRELSRQRPAAPNGNSLVLTASAGLPQPDDSKTEPDEEKPRSEMTAKDMEEQCLFYRYNISHNEKKLFELKRNGDLAAVAKLEARQEFLKKGLASIQEEIRALIEDAEVMQAIKEPHPQTEPEDAAVDLSIDLQGMDDKDLDDYIRDAKEQRTSQMDAAAANDIEDPDCQRVSATCRKDGELWKQRQEEAEAERKRRKKGAKGSK